MVDAGFAYPVNWAGSSGGHSADAGDDGADCHALVKVFGRQREVGERFRPKNAELYEASFGA